MEVSAAVYRHFRCITVRSERKRKRKEKEREKRNVNERKKGRREIKRNRRGLEGLEIVGIKLGAVAELAGDATSGLPNTSKQCRAQTVTKQSVS